MFDIALATCASLPELDSDNALLIPALAERGLRARPVVWNAPEMGWSQPQMTVIRATWDYHHQRADFLTWAEHVASLNALWNPLDILRWNTHKFYLRDLEEQGIPIVPTLWLEQGAQVNLASLMMQHNWSRVILKPAVSASAHATLLITSESVEAGQAHLEQYLPGNDMLLQPFLSTVTSSRERSLIFIDGVFTHAIERAPALNLDASAEDRLITAQEDELSLSQRLLTLLPTQPLYARVDLIHDEAGMLRLMELELVEPGLWLALAPHAVEHFADAIARKVKVGRRC